MRDVGGFKIIKSQLKYLKDVRCNKMNSIASVGCYSTTHVLVCAWTQVVCRQLGYIEADRVSTYTTEFGQGTGTIWMSNVACSGSESSLDQCPFNGWGYYSYYYYYYTDAGVVCRGTLFVCACIAIVQVVCIRVVSIL